MPTLRYYDGTQYQPLPGLPGQVYAAVAATAPPAANPIIAPPQGALWVDTSTTTPWTPTAYFPPQTPPPTGTNTFTDSSGEVWMSRNGSAWKKARDALHARVYRNAAYNVPTTTVPFPFDTVTRDPYAMWTGGTYYTFTVPIAGIWQATSLIVGQVGADGGWINNILCQTDTVQMVWGGANAGAANSSVGVGFNERLNCVAGDRISCQCQAGGSTAILTGSMYCYLTIDYLGTG